MRTTSLNKDWHVPEEKPRRNKWFDMCILDLGHKEISAWWTGAIWEGLRYKGQEILRWKYLGVRDDQEA